MHDRAMSEDFVSLKMLLLSETGPERQLVRQAANRASVPVDVTERETPGDKNSLTQLLAENDFDVVFFDSRFAKPVRQEVLAITRAAPSKPLAVLIGPASIKTREVLTDGLEVDSTLAKPIEVQEVCDLLERCSRARLPKRVLLVDDSSTVRAVVRKVLQASRFKLEIADAASGADAVALHAKRPFDVVFLDCEMPGMDGYATLAGLRSANADSKVVMITGTRDHRLEDRARAEGAKDFLFKPFFAKDIDAVLNRLFGLSN